MGRKKSHPVRSGGIIAECILSDRKDAEQKLASSGCPESADTNDRDLNYESTQSLLVEIDRSHWTSDMHFDIAEIVLKDLKFSDGFGDHRLVEDWCKEPNIALRFRLPRLEDECFRLGHWPVLSVDSLVLEFVVLNKRSLDDKEIPFVVFSGIFDGSDEAVSGLVHLVSQKFMTLRPVSEVRNLRDDLSFRARVEILGRAFDSCESLLEVARKPWKKSLMSVMSWLRPDVTTSEAKYGMHQLEFEGLNGCKETAGRFDSRKLSSFDAAGFYEAIRPSKEEPMLEDELPELLPVLRPYQRRAAYWMVQRERKLSKSNDDIQRQSVSPLCVPVVFLGSDSRMFYNPFSGNVALHQEASSSYVAGGILADEMGLGKTVELLACILSHRMSSLVKCLTSNDETQDKVRHIKRLKRERVECVCGAVTECSKYKGLWVQCDNCDAWQHADCVGYSPKVNHANCRRLIKERGFEKDSSRKSTGRARLDESTNIVEMDGNFICPSCSELIEASHATMSTGATLIVCPAPILAQWHSEIIRHTKPGSLKTCIYEGARSVAPSSSLKTDIRELASADIVLTTYDVLKEDLSHDSDRYDGDHRCMRFQKRYPVVPTLLTRMDWWRLCLDEAQMVESNTGAVTEMALRLHARHRWCITGTPIQRKLDDLYGLLHFLSAGPFDVYRWWAEVIRIPYERKDWVAMEFVHRFFKQIMWRSTKADISEELQLPPQEECVSWLTFSPVEEHFYQKQHESCMRCAHEVIGRLKEDIITSESVSGFDSILSHSEAAKLLYPLLKLRQACCHPQVGSSGLRSLQQSPMTMDEILDVLISKAKTEGEEALRRIIVALNGLAAIAAIEQDYMRATSLYQEALAVAEENTNDFRLDPLLSLHIHHNLSDLIPFTSGYLQNPSTAEPHCEKSNNTTNSPGCGRFVQCYVKRRRVSKSSESSEQINEGPKFVSDLSLVGVNASAHNGLCQTSSGLFADGFLRQKCESIKKKYLSVFISKWSLAQQEFRNSYTQVCNIFTEFKDQYVNWWSKALNLIEQNKNSSDELIRKIDEAVFRAGNDTGSSRVSSRFRTISGLKLTIHSALESLENSRQAVLERLTEIDGIMNEPKDDDIERVRFCSRCQSGDGQLCIHCELDDSFQVYEARLFHLKKGNFMAASAEEAIDLQNQKKELNSFFRISKKFHETSFVDNENKGQRHASKNVVVYKCPSDLEIVLGVIKSYSKSHLGRQGLSSATKHLLLFETMRKEFSHARCLSSAQAQLLSAHDEIKMSTSRLRLKEREDEPTAINVLSSEELIPSSLQFTSDKTSSLSSLLHIKGQLRYLKGLILSKQKTQDDHTNIPSRVPSTVLSALSQPHAVKQNERQDEADDEPCPICHEKLSYQKMVFPCGHVTCCKCCLEMTEQAIIRHGRSQQKCVMCPTCRQQTKLENIAFVDDRQKVGCDLKSLHGHDMSEISFMVRGSYGTKIEAVTRRILRIKGTNQEAKVLVFSSWNDVLDVLEHALCANGISYIRMKGGRKSQVAIKQFQGDKSPSEGSRKSRDRHPKSESIQVLLLLIQHGANGLNLLEAQHVILIEPLLNPAAEAQAINRVHRIGQEKKTFIHRFIVKGTVEESICKLNQSRNVNPIIGAPPKHRDQPVLTIRDFESLFSPIQMGLPKNDEVPVGSLRHLPPAVAAGLAAEGRLMEASS